MSMQKFRASLAHVFTFGNGAVGYASGGSFDCLGPYAKVVNCPIDGTDLRRTCYATAYADTFFSIPACTRVNGRYIRGFFTVDDRHENGRAVVFVPMADMRDRLTVTGA